jgi:hypothetical protein
MTSTAMDGSRFTLASRTESGATVRCSSGEAVAIEPTEEEKKDGFVAFELLISEVVTTRYDEIGMNPSSERWSAGPA